MLTCKSNELHFSFPEIHPKAACSLTFQRTLRLPDNDKTYPLPPGLGAFPLKLVDDHADRLSDDTTKRGGVMLPMYQAEAMWIRFSTSVEAGTMPYPIALKIGAGKRSAVTGKAWEKGLAAKDYVVVPVQPWLDGFMLESGVIRQFVAAPLGQGFTVEEQLTGKAEFGGLQIEAFPMKRAMFDALLEKKIAEERARAERMRSQVAPGGSGNGIALPRSRASFGGSPPPPARASASMGMAAGGRMKQEIHPDPYGGPDAWDLTHSNRTFVHLFNSMVWREITGHAPPQVPPTAGEYAKAGLPWYDWYSEAGALGATSETAKIKSLDEMAQEKGYGILPENQSVDVKPTVTIAAPKDPFSVGGGEW